MTATQSLEVEGVGNLVLPSGHVALFDAADRALVEQYRWCANVGKHTVYVQSGGCDRPLVQMHRLILSAPRGLDVDHRNGNGLDNRRLNLRLSTRAQNQANKRISVLNTSGYKGVSLTRSGRWHAYIRVDGRRRHLGFFTDPWLAAQAYNAAALEAWGEFARLNEQVPA